MIPRPEKTIDMRAHTSALRSSRASIEANEEATRRKLRNERPERMNRQIPQSLMTAKNRIVISMTSIRPKTKKTSGLDLRALININRRSIDLHEGELELDLWI